jgi:hypothetical protein
MELSSSLPSVRGPAGGMSLGSAHHFRSPAPQRNTFLEQLLGGSRVGAVECDGAALRNPEVNLPCYPVGEIVRTFQISGQ